MTLSLEHLGHPFQEELAFVTLSFPFKSLEKPPLLSCQSLSFQLLSVCLFYPPGPILTGLCLRGELHCVFLGRVGQWGLRTEVGHQGLGFEPLCSQVWSGLPSQVLQ